MEGLCAATQPWVEQDPVELTETGRRVVLAAVTGFEGALDPLQPLIAADPLLPLVAADTAGRAAADRLAQAIAATFCLRERVRPQYAMALARLERLGRPVTVGQFTRLCLIESNASYAVDRLRELGLVRSAGPAGDGRCREVELSEAGAAWLERLRAELAP